MDNQSNQSPPNTLQPPVSGGSTPPKPPTTPPASPAPQPPSGSMPQTTQNPPTPPNPPQPNTQPSSSQPSTPPSPPIPPSLQGSTPPPPVANQPSPTNQPQPQGSTPPTTTNQPPPPPQPGNQPQTTPPPSSPPGPSPENPSIAASPDQVAPKRPPILRILLILIVLVALGAAAFFGFRYFTNRGGGDSTPTNSDSTTGNQANSGTTITYWGLWETEAVIGPILDDFQQQTGITVDYTQHSPQDYRERLQSALARGQGPDVFRFHNTWVPMFRQELASLPSSVMSPQEFSTTFYPVASQDLTVSGSILGIPLMIDGLGLYYNQEMLDTAGATPPASWDELRSLASRLTIYDGDSIQRAGIALGLTSNVDNFSDILGVMLLQNGADPANPTTRSAQDAITFYRLFASSDRVWDSTLAPSTYAFATEKVAMIVAPSWRAHEISQINPELDFAIAPLPQLPSSDISWASYWVEGVSNQSDKQQAAWQLLEYLSSPEVLTQMYSSASSTRLFGEPYSRVDMQDELIGDPYVGAFVSQAETAASWPMASRTFDNGLNAGIIKAYEDALNAGGTEAALTQATNEINRILSLYSASTGTTSSGN